ncbi:MAG: hypothetical protein IJ802_01145, partial [Kiritimatiellae bacterium]|nr:hypothetical protein [Kiritimatiellia bacterium]
MTSPVKRAMTTVMRTATRRRGTVETHAMGKTRTFHAYDMGEDTFIFEDGVWKKVGEHASVLMVAKCDLRRGEKGHVMTVTSGNHSVAAIPLLAGQFWGLASIRPGKRGAVLSEKVLCANVVGSKIEISQRDVATRRLVELDEWVRETLAFSLDDIVMIERNDATLQYYRSLGQEWRIKPLAWTELEMRSAIASSRKRISTRLRYYHSVKGVHFLSMTDFAVFASRARTDWDEFTRELREMTGVFEGNRESFLRQAKFHGHHEIEFFGLPRNWATRPEGAVPRLEKLMEDIVLERITRDAAADEVDAIFAAMKQQLTQKDLLDDKSPCFAELLYMHLTGEVYNVMGDGSSRAFDDRRTALKGATFVDG